MPSRGACLGIERRLGCTSCPSTGGVSGSAGSSLPPQLSGATQSSLVLLLSLSMFVLLPALQGASFEGSLGAAHSLDGTPW